MVEEWVLALTATPWIFVVLYLLATIDGFFPPVPSESVVITLAVLALQPGGPSFPMILVVAAAGAFTGDFIAYTLGGRVDVHRLRFLRGKKGQQALVWAERALAQRGASFIIAGRYVPVGRVAVNLTAGALRFPRPRFLLYAVIAACSWSIYSVAIGVGAGAWLYEQPLLAVVVGVVGGVSLGLIIDQVMTTITRRRLGALRLAESRPGARHRAASGSERVTDHAAVDHAVTDHEAGEPVSGERRSADHEAGERGGGRRGAGRHEAGRRKADRHDGAGPAHG